jgi:hypothetical protein
MEPATKKPQMNRTGIDIAPVLSEAMMSGMEHIEQDPSRGNEAIVGLERDYIHPDARVGSMPPPSTVSGELKALTDEVVGKDSQVLLNKLGERLAFERSGVRAYEAFIRKCMLLSDGSDGNGSMSGLPLDELWNIRNDEEEHFLLLQQCMKMLGGDPTAQTPDADVAGVASSGIVKVLSDPRTSIAQGLQALMMIELTDNASWELLIELSSEVGVDEMTERFRRALEQEEFHLASIRQWYEKLVMSQALRGDA